MALALGLSEAGHLPARIDTTARVTIDNGPGRFSGTHIDLVAQGVVSDLDTTEFERYAETAKANCPVSRALAGTEIRLQAKLLI